jgi:hypothetical protein
MYAQKIAYPRRSKEGRAVCPIALSELTVEAVWVAMLPRALKSLKSDCGAS